MHGRSSKNDFLQLHKLSRSSSSTGRETSRELSEQMELMRLYQDSCCIIADC